MSSFARRHFRSAAFFVLCISVLATCKDSSGPPEERVTSVQTVSGDLQGGIVAAALTQPLVAQALDSEGRPVRGAQVEWQVTTGAGSITSAATTTDNDGRTSATWTLGTAAGEQTASITIGTASATFRATAVAGPAATVAVVPASLSLDAIGATAALQATARDVHDNPITGRAAVWATTDATVVSVDQTGTVRAVRTGTAQVSATLDGATGEASVTVQPVPATIQLSPPSATFTAVGQTVQFEATSQDRNGNPVVPAQGYTWSSSAPAIVSVTSAGLAKAEAAGFAQVRASVGSVTGQAQVTVAQTVVSLVVSPSADTLTTARPAAQLTVTAKDINNQPIPSPAVTWTTSNAAIATVSQTGLVSAVANGIARIRATSGTAADSATITVRLNTPPKAVLDSLAAGQNTPLVVAAPGVLGNDTLGIPPGTVTSFGGGSLGGTVTTNVAGTTVTFGTGGSLRVNPDGSVSFVPVTGFTGSFTFQYRIQNAAGVSDATVTIEVGLPPAAVDDAYPTTVNAPVAIPPATGLMMNDDRGFPLAFVASFGGGDLGGAVTTFPAGQLVAFGIAGFVGGQLRVNADGSLSFTPPIGYVGSFTVQYRLSNGVGTSDATITFTIAPAPVPDRTP